MRLYSRNYCHLCHDMLAALEALRGEPGVPDFEIEVLDVDADPELEAPVRGPARTEHAAVAAEVKSA